MKLTPEEVYQAVAAASTMTLDGSPLLTEPYHEPLEGDPEHEWMNVRWANEDGDIATVAFTEAGLVMAEQKGVSILMPNSKGEMCEIALFNLIPVLKAAPTPP